MIARIPDQEEEPERDQRGSGSDPPRRVRGLPETVAVGGGTALRLDGALDSGLLPLRALRIRLGELERDVDGFGRTGEDGNVSLLWWAVFPLPASAPSGPAEVTILADGLEGRTEIPLGSVRLEGAADLSGVEPSSVGDGSRPLIAICMATFEPGEQWLRRQLDSIRAQGWKRWVCLISDDASSAASFAVLQAAVADDPRFVVSRSRERLGFYANFERALRMAPPEADLFALCDQDDRWHPDKLEALVATLEASPRALLAYSDMRMVDERGTVLSETFWYLRRNRCDDIASLLIANTVTGAASLFRRDLLDLALPFPPGGTGGHYHDQWLALCALVTGEIAYLDRPTYDYTRHLDSVTIAAAADWYVPPHGFRERAALRWRRLTRRVRRAIGGPDWREIYLERILMIRQLIAVLELRTGSRISPAKRRSLGLLESADRSPRAAIWLAARILRPLIRRNETLARERILLGALVWRMIAVRRARRS